MKVNNPNWPKEYTLAEFAKLNPHIINENQLIQLYNQYLNKYLQEQQQQQIHFQQSKFTQLINEFQNCQIVECTNQVLSTMGVGGSYLNTPHPLSSFLRFTGDTNVEGVQSLYSYVRTLGGPIDLTPSNPSIVYQHNNNQYSGSNGGGFTARKNKNDSSPFGYDLFANTPSAGKGTENNYPNTFFDGATFSLWIKPHEFGVAGNPMVAFGRGSNTDHSQVFGINGDDIYFDIGETIGSSSASPVLLATTSASVISAPHGMELNKWYHWTIKISNDSTTLMNGGPEFVKSIRPVTFYRDGVEVLSTFYKFGEQTGEDGTGYSYGISDAHAMYIGGDGRGDSGVTNDAWAFSISEFAIFNVQKDIKDVYNASDPYRPVEFDKDTRGLIAYWKFDDGPNSPSTKVGIQVKDYGPLGFNSVIRDVPGIAHLYNGKTSFATFNEGVSAVDGGY